MGSDGRQESQVSRSLKNDALPILGMLKEVKGIKEESGVEF